MKASDYIVSFFENYGIKYIFGYQGGMITHLVDSISKSKNISFIQTYHEQSAAFAAEGYARETNLFGVAISTSGPGATNLITGIADAFFDSIPVIFITGQVNSYEYKYNKKLRQQGFQETDIVQIVTPITKYAVLIDKKLNLQYELQKAVLIATTGRKGPVLLDIPMDIQRSELVKQIISIPKYEIKKNYDNKFEQLIVTLKNAKKPLVLCGGGILTSGCKDSLKKFLTKNTLPFIVSLMGKGTTDEFSSLFLGMIGSYGNRCANIILSKSDVVLVLGSRLDLRQTGNQKAEVLSHITFLHIDIDENELEESNLPVKKNYHMDLNLFFHLINSNPCDFSINDEWKAEIENIKEKYNQEKEIERFVKNSFPYRSLQAIQKLATNNTVFTVDIGQNQMWAAQILRLRESQLFFTSGGLAPMGYAIPVAVGVAFSNHNKNVICITGDGGFHIAIQSLQLISQYNLKITIFVLNNESLGMITQFQDLYFNSNMAGTTRESGYLVPNIESIAMAYSLKYACIKTAEQLDMLDISAQIVEIKIGCKTVVSPKLEFDKPLFNMLPYLSEEEINQII